MSTHRILDSVNELCPCGDYYYDVGVALCAPCDSTCLTCFNFAAECHSCDSANHRTIDGNTCPCDDGYFHDSIAMCSKCDSNCLTCVN